jgi:predicted transcriptional regulator
MKLEEVAAALSAKVLCGSQEQLESEVSIAAASDLMSDILARVGVPDVMLTGLATTQTVHTSAVAGIKAVVFVRGKPIDEKIVALAREEDIVLMTTRVSLFEASGRLYQKGMRGGVKSS